MKRIIGLGLAFLFLAGAVGAEELSDAEIAALAKRVQDYPTKFRLIRLAHRAVPALMDQASVKDAGLRFETRSALRYIAIHAGKDRMEAERAAQAVLPYIDQGREAGLRSFAAELLGEIRVPTTIGVLEAAASDQDAAVHLAAIDAIVRFDRKTAIESIVRLDAALDSRAPSPRLIRAMGEMQDARFTAGLGGLAKGGDEETSLAAIAALGASGDPMAEEALAAAAASAPSEKSKAAARAALQTLGEALLYEGKLVPAAGAFVRAVEVATDDAARTAAIEGLGAAGDLASIESFMTGATKSAALRALVLIADRRLADGDAAGAAELYRRVLGSPDDEVATLRAIAGCGRARDAEAVDAIGGLIEEGAPRVRSAAIAALREVPGPAATKRLVEVAGKLEGPMLVATIEAIGERRDTAAIEGISKLAAREDAAVAAAAIRALATIGDASCEPAVWQAVEGGAEGVRRAAAEAYLGMATSSPPERARGMYHKLLGSRDAASTHAEALAAIEKNATPESLPVLEKYLETAEGDRREAALKACVAVADSVAAAGRRDEAVAVLKRLLEAGSLPGAEAKLRALGEAVELTAQGGRVDAWWVVGPFPSEGERSWKKAHFPEKDVERASHEEGGRTYEWESMVSTSSDGYIDWDAHYEENENVVAYAFAEVVVKTDREAVLKVGSDDGVVVWVNGEEVHSKLVPRGFVAEEDSVSIKLNKGSNAILVKVIEIGGGWGFAVRLVDGDGKALRFKIR